MHQLRHVLGLLTLTLSVVACGDSGDTDPSTGGGGGGTGGDGAGAASEGGGGAASDVERGPALLDIDGDANGLWWDDEESILYIADDNGNRILRWTDEDSFSLVADLPSAAKEGAGLGQLVKTADGTIVVTRFGFGTAGDVAYVTPGGEAEIVPDLDPERRRIGLTVAADGTLYDSWFVRLSTGDRVGAIGTLTLAGVEPEVVTGLTKPVGVLVVGDELVITDQDLGQVLVAPLDSPMDYEVLAAVAGPDLVAAGPDGSLFTGSSDGSLYRIEANGDAAVFETGFQQVRGVAYDPTNRRLFVADHDGDESDGISHVLHILPVD